MRFESLAAKGTSLPPAHIRLRASRLTAGFLTLKSASAALEIPETTYRAAEKGSRKITAGLLDKAAALFAVTRTFIAEGEVQIEADFYAGRAAVRVERYLSFGKTPAEREVVKSSNRRLMEARLFARYKTAADAATRLGFNASSYSACERGVRPIPLDRLVYYAAKLGCSYDYLLFAEGRSPKPSSVNQDWKIAASSAPDFYVEPNGEISPQPPSPLPPPTPPPQNTEWHWLKGWNGLPVLTAEHGRLTVSDTPFMMHPGLHSDRKLTSDLFAVLGESRQTLIVCRPYSGERDAPLVMWDGKRLFESGGRPGLIAVDPVLAAASPAAPVVVGERVGRIDFRL
jgi:transcriptional regulator with XRE-family HTH domain